MSDLPEAVLAILKPFDKREDGFDESEVSGAFGRLLKEDKTGETLCESARPHRVLFRLSEGSGADSSPWGTYFGPVFTGTLDDGTNWESPSIHDVTKEVLEAWRAGYAAVQHPILKARYADAIWDLSAAATVDRPDVSYARTAIDCYVAIATGKRYDYVHDAFHKLARAQSLALSINDPERVRSVTKAIIGLAKAALDDHPQAWGAAYDLLLNNPKLNLPEHEENEIIDALEGRLGLVANPANEGGGGFDPFAAQDVAFRLAEYYRKRGDLQEAQRVILAYGQAFEHIGQKAMGLLALSWWETVHEAYRTHGLTEEAERLLLLMKQKGRSAENEMGTISVSQEIPKEELTGMLDWLVEGDLASALAKFAAALIPDADQERQSLAEMAKTHPLLGLMPIKIVGDGHSITQVGSVAEDFDRRLARLVSESLSYATFWMTLLSDRLREAYDLKPEALVSLL